jgi:hypothetical protein
VFAVFWTLHERVSRSGCALHEYLTFRPELDRDATLTTTGESSDTEFRAHLFNTYEELKRRLENEPIRRCRHVRHCAGRYGSFLAPGGGAAQQ